MSTSTRTRLNPEQRKQQLLEAAVEVFARRGLGRAAHADIAEATGVSVPTVFNYFKTREDLVDAVLSHIENTFEQTAAEFHHRDNALDDPYQTMVAHSFSFLQRAKQESDIAKIWLEWSASVREDTWPRYLAFQNKILDIIEPTIQAGLDKGQMNSQLSARDLARIVFGQSHPVTMAYFDPDQPITDMLQFVQQAMNSLLGLKLN